MDANRGSHEEGGRKQRVTKLQHICIVDFCFSHGFGGSMSGTSFQNALQKAEGDEWDRIETAMRREVHTLPPPNSLH